MAKKKNKKVVRYRRPLNINVGMIIFALIFLYMAFYLYTYLRRDKVEFYEVVEGSIVNDTRHTGIIFRTEEPKYTDRAGNINFYLREGKAFRPARGKNGRVCSPLKGKPRFLKKAAGQL